MSACGNIGTSLSPSDDYACCLPCLGSFSGRTCSWPELTPSPCFWSNPLLGVCPWASHLLAHPRVYCPRGSDLWRWELPMHTFGTFTLG